MKQETPMTTQPYILPPDFNPATSMLMKTTEYGAFHESRQAAHLAAALIANGTAQDLELAERILLAVLKCQELDVADPHFGNFYWMAEDDHVEDLNAVEFVLEEFIPMMLRHGERLSAEMRRRVLESIRLGLNEIERLDVLVAYTNITVLDILNTCLGGELLGDDRIAQRGYGKLAGWIDYTNQSGHPMEYNSPTYSAVTLRALKLLADLVQDDATRQRTQAVTARLALSVALHIHTGVGRWVGPHGRAYQPSVVCETPPEIDLLNEWIDQGIVPDWITDVMARAESSFEVVETAERTREIALTTYHAPSFALGSASGSFHNQANVCMAHYRRPQAERPGVFYTRYILDDKWFGDSYHATDRTKTRNLPDEGAFFGVQEQNRVLSIYSPLGMDHCFSAKAACIWTRLAEIDEIVVAGQRITDLPYALPPGEPLVVASGDAYIALLPMTISALGRETPITLLERDGDLVLEMANYRGPQKRFWELNWPGAFFKGRPFISFYLEMAERSAHDSAATFAAEVQRGSIQHELAPPFTYFATGERRYAVSYKRDGCTLGLELDIMQWRLLRRWTSAGDPGWPMLESALARQSAGGEVQVGDAHVFAAHGPVWLFANPERGCWVAGYLGNQPTSLSLHTPQGVVDIPVMAPGTVIWRNGQIVVQGTPQQQGVNLPG
jgi:hypothetical protein